MTVAGMKPMSLDRIHKGDIVEHTLGGQTGTVMSGRLQKIDRCIPGKLYRVLWDDERDTIICSDTMLKVIGSNAQ